MRNQPSGMGTKDGSNGMETADCDREADIFLGMAAGLLPRLKFTSAGWRNGNRKRRWFPHKILRQSGEATRARRLFQGGADFKTDAKRSLRTAQYADDFGDFVFLKEANRGNACGTSIEAGTSVIESDAAQGEDGDVSAASFTQGFKAGGQRAGCVFFF